jgi:hypothetical protein
LSIVNKAHQRSSSISRPRNLVGFSLEWDPIIGPRSSVSLIQCYGLSHRKL